MTSFANRNGLIYATDELLWGKSPSLSLSWSTSNICVRDQHWCQFLELVLLILFSFSITSSCCPVVSIMKKSWSHTKRRIGFGEFIICSQQCLQRNSLISICPQCSIHSTLTPTCTLFLPATGDLSSWRQGTLSTNMHIRKPNYKFYSELILFLLTEQFLLFKTLTHQSALYMFNMWTINYHTIKSKNKVIVLVNVKNPLHFCSC